jgi:hypothetical protein
MSKRINESTPNALIGRNFDVFTRNRADREKDTAKEENNIQQEQNVAREFSNVPRK